MTQSQAVQPSPDLYIPTYAGADLGVRLTPSERETLAWRTAGDASGDLPEGLVFAVEEIVADRIRDIDDDDDLKHLIDALDMLQRDRRRALARYKPLRNIALEAHLDSIDHVLDEFRQTNRDANDDEEV